MTQVVTELTVDARGATQGSAEYVRAMAVAQAAVDRLRDREDKLAAGAGKATDMLMVQSASIGRVASNWDRLRASIDPVTRAEVAAARELDRAMLTADAAVKRGVASQQEAARIVSALRQKQIVDLNAVREAAQRANAAQNAPVAPIAANQNRRLSSGQWQGLSFQANDVVTMALLGAPMSQIAASQAGQVLQLLQQGDGGVKGSLQAIKGGAADAVKAVVGFLGPLGLIASGFGVAAVAAGAYYLLTRENAKTLDEAIEGNRKAIVGLAEAYGIAGLKADEFGKKSVLALEAGARESRIALEARARLEASALVGLFGSESAQGRFGRGFTVGSQYSAFAGPIAVLQKQIKEGRADFAWFEGAVDRIAATDPTGLRKTGDEIIRMAQSAAQANKELRETAELLKTASRGSVGGIGAMDRAQEAGRAELERLRRMGIDPFGDIRIDAVAEEVAAARRRDAAEAQLQGMLARSPAEKAAAARAAAGAQYNESESAAARADRIDIAGKLALAEAEKGLAEARRERARSLDETLASQQLEISLIGQTVGEVARLRMEYDLTSKLREEAARNGVEADQKEIELIKQKAAEYGRYADEIARTNLLREVQFEREQLFRTSGDQAIASRLRGAGLPVDLNSDIANAIRENQRIEALRAGIRGFFDDFQAGLMQGDSFGKALGNAILNALNKALDGVIDKLVNSIVNSLVGGVSGGGSSSGVIGSILGAIGLGGKSGSGSGADPWSALRDVTSGSAVTRMFAPANSNNDMSIFRQAISAIESAGSGGYSALGPWTRGDRAYGAYQVMGANIPSWTKQALGTSMTPSQFLANPRAQDSVFDHFFGKSISKYGNPQDAASVWFTGRPLSGGAGAKDVLGTSGSVYVDKFNDQLDKLGGSAEKTASAMLRTGTAGNQAAQGLQQTAGGLSGFAQQLQSFMGSAQGGGSSWFQGLSGMFGGVGGAFSFMNSISPLATLDILSGSWGAFAKGGTFGTNIVPFAKGGSFTNSIVDRRTLFSFANGSKFGEMGEAGPEAIVPLRRGPDGSLGVAAARGGGVVVNINNLGGSNVSAESREEADGSTAIDIIVDRVVADKLSRRGTAANNTLRTQFGAREALKRR